MDFFFFFLKHIFLLPTPVSFLHLNGEKVSLFPVKPDFLGMRSMRWPLCEMPLKDVPDQAQAMGCAHGRTWTGERIPKGCLTLLNISDIPCVLVSSGSIRVCYVGILYVFLKDKIAIQSLVISRWNGMGRKLHKQMFLVMFSCGKMPLKGRHGVGGGRYSRLLRWGVYNCNTYI